MENKQICCCWIDIIEGMWQYHFVYQLVTAFLVSILFVVYTSITVGANNIGRAHPNSKQDCNYVQVKSVLQKIKKQAIGLNIKYIYQYKCLFHLILLPLANILYNNYR